MNNSYEWNGTILSVNSYIYTEFNGLISELNYYTAVVPNAFSFVCFQ